ncbi:MAG: alpha/beta hydrolase, partial [Christensenellales bacterium]
MKDGKYHLDERRTISLGGRPAHIRIRGTSEENPVLLFLHGGPGISDRHWVLKYQSDLSDICTLVCWDQRGSGKSYTKQQGRQSVTVEDMVSDASELLDYLCDRFSKDKIYIVGHSWGSVLGVLLTTRRPERVAAYIGMGQVVNLDENERISYGLVLDEARRRGDKRALGALERIGEPQGGRYGSIDDLITQRNYMSKYGGASYNRSESIWTSMVLPLLRSPEYSLGDMLGYAKGSFYSLKQLWDQVCDTCFDQSVTRMDVPVYITQGRHDWNTPPSISHRWFERLEA